MKTKNPRHVQEVTIKVRALIKGELDPSEGQVPVCAFNKKHLASHEASAPLRPPWKTCLPCAEAGKKAVGLNTEFKKLLEAKE